MCQHLQEAKSKSQHAMWKHAIFKWGCSCRTDFHRDKQREIRAPMRAELTISATGSLEFKGERRQPWNQSVPLCTCRHPRSRTEVISPREHPGFISLQREIQYFRVNNNLQERFCM